MHSQLDERALDGAGELLLRFVNTRAIVNTPEHFGDADTTHQWFVGAGLIEPDTFVSEADAVGARELRTALVTVLKEHVGVEDSEEAHLAVNTLGRAAVAHPFALQFGQHGAELVSTQSGFAGAIGTVLADVAAVALDPHAWARFKACKNPACYLGFRDRTRNGSGLYCSHTCASQVSMRAYRQRQSH